MTYMEFAKGISEHPKGWRYGFMSGEIYMHASSSTQEEVRVMRDCVHMMYELFSNDASVATRMLSNRSDLVTAAVEVWLKQ